MSTILAKIFHHNRWANLRLVDACAGLDASELASVTLGTYGSIALTLLHAVSLTHLKIEPPELDA